MSNSDNSTDKDFVMSDSDLDAEQSDAFENETYQSVADAPRKTSAMPSIIITVGFLIVIILLIAVLSRSQDLAEKKQLLMLETRLEELERRLSGIENTRNQSTASAMPEKQLDLVVERLDRLENLVNAKMDQVITELKPAKQTLDQPKPPLATTPPPVIKEKEDLKPKVHRVQAGETLYRISRLYGLTVEQLRTYNKLGPNASIYPGQELRLTP